jgi:hypothetical protein
VAGDRQADAEAAILHIDRNLATLRRELDRVRQQIPDDLLETRGVAPD